MKNTFFLFFLLGLKLHAQNEIDTKLKNLFFGLNVNSCNVKIEKEIENSKLFKFDNEIDTISNGNLKFKLKKFSLSSNYKLKDNKQSLVDCDSTYILLHPIFAMQSTSHGKVDHEKLYGHSASMVLYFSDSVKANKAFKDLTDSISNTFEKEYISSDLEVNEKVVGKSSTIYIDKKNNDYEYKRELVISIMNYENLYVLKIDFSKFTIKTEDCLEE